MRCVSLHDFPVENSVVVKLQRKQQHLVVVSLQAWIESALLLVDTDHHHHHPAC